MPGINISLGDPCLSPRRVGEAVRKAYDKGTIIVAAAGNITSEVVYPARYPQSVAAGGVTRDSEPWSGGSRGSLVDLCAPAERVTRANAYLDGGHLRYDYGDNGDGTSYASVHIAGAACLWLAFHGAALSVYGKTWRLVEAFRICVKRGARRPLGWDGNRFGAGILDIANLLSVPPSGAVGSAAPLRLGEIRPSIPAAGS